MNRAEKKSSLGAVVLAVLGSLCAAVYYIPFKKAVASMDSDVFVMAMFLISFGIHLVPLPVTRWSLSFNRTTLVGGLVFGVLAVLANYACGKSLEGLSPSLTVVLIRTQVLLIMLFGWLMFKESVNRYLWIGAVLAMSGVIVAAYSQQGFVIHKLTGIFWALASMVAFALINVLVKLIIKKVEPVSLNILRMLSSAAIIAILPGRVAAMLNLDQDQWLLVFLSALFGPVFSRILYMYSLRILPISQFVIISMLSPAFALLLAWVFLNDVPMTVELIGGSMVLMGVCIPAMWKQPEQAPRCEKSTGS